MITVLHTRFALALLPAACLSIMLSMPAQAAYQLSEGELARARLAYQASPAEQTNEAERQVLTRLIREENRRAGRPRNDDEEVKETENRLRWHETTRGKTVYMVQDANRGGSVNAIFGNDIEVYGLTTPILMIMIDGRQNTTLMPPAVER